MYLPSQCEKIYDDQDRLLVDFVGRFERLLEDFKKVCQRLELGDIELPRTNATVHDHYSRYYNNETKKIVADHYAKDIDFFGYVFEVQPWIQSAFEVSRRKFYDVTRPIRHRLGLKRPLMNKLWNVMSRSS